MSADWRTLPLQGRALVEASAGTGKTWTLAMLYLRVLLELGLAPAAIAVTTFTEAAAQELRGRIRDRLRQARAVLEGGPPAEQELGEYLRELPERPETLRRRLQLALMELDQAPIGTLHGLCLGLLRECPLDTDSDPMGLELVDEAALQRGLIDDLWRQRMQTSSALDAVDTCLLEHGREWLQRQLPGLLAPATAVRAPDPEQLADCALLGATGRAAALRALADRSDLYRRSNAAIRTQLRQLADLLEAGGSTPEGEQRAPRFELLASAHADLAAITQQFADGVLPLLAADPDFQFALRAGAAAAQAPRRLAGAALARARSDLLALRQAHLASTRSIGYEDMIERVHTAVRNQTNGFAERLHARWPVAMIDEFQDTDPRQYAIFDRVFRHASGSLRGCLLLVGDPKQAIYRFRGGDIHTYQRAAAACPERISLDTNYRASRAMVAAINELYANAGDGFRIPPGPGHFGYVDLQASARRDDAAWTEHGTVLTRPLRLHALDATDDPLRAPHRVRAAIESCADVIAAALNDGSERTGGQPLHPGQIAVLLPRHSDVAAMREALRRRAVPASGAGRSDVFSTEWARALQLQLWAWLHPDDGSALREVLRSPLYAWPLAALHPSAAHSGRLADAQHSCAEQARRWRRAGIQAAVGALVDARLEALLADPQAGERAITDLRHLGELLAEAEAAGQHHEALWHWLAAQREQPDDDIGRRQLRIESDGRRVRLMTLHASKGLEFDWVLLPLLWNHTHRASEWPLGWDQGLDQRVLDLGSRHWQQTRDSARTEDQRERLRVLYVALTRAVYRCDVWAMDPERPAHARGRSALAEELRSALDLLLAPLFQRAAGTSLQYIDWRNGWPGADARLNLAEPATRLPAWPALPAAPALESLVSFSSLAHRARTEARGAQDESDPQISHDSTESQAHPLLQAWAPLRGPTLGNALHSILERRSLGQPLRDQHPLIARCLHEFGLDPGVRDPAWVARIAARLDAVLETELGPGLHLGQLASTAQRAELDFRLRLDQVSLRRLGHVLHSHGQADLLPAGLPDQPLRGLLSGKIDLVFEHAGRVHVLDYKSNHLGCAIQDYLGEPLQHAMQASGYRFQALLYTLAVHRYLRGRLHGYDPERQLGDCWYVFLRAVGLAPAAGVWRTRLAPGLLDAVDTVFAGATG
jgi:exodeoxyribonuclease V beta subunit